MAAGQLRNVPVTPRVTAAALALALGAAVASAEHPGRTLESRRASAPVVYLATVSAVEDLGIDETGPGIAMMRASLVVDRMFRSEAPPPPPSSSPSPPPSPPVNTTVRFRRLARPEDGLSGQQFYELAPGNRVVVFAPSYEPSHPIEMITGSATTVATQVAALRAYLAEMDEMTQRLHGVTPALRAKQTALYDRILAELRGASAP